ISVGWLPGAWIFPLAIDRLSGSLPVETYWRFGGSFTLAWLISASTTISVGIFLLVRGFYPKFWSGDPETAARELGLCERLNRKLLIGAALIPMAGVLFSTLLAPPPEEFTLGSYHSFRILVLMIVGFGLLNLMFIQRLTRLTEASIAVLRKTRTFA